MTEAAAAPTQRRIESLDFVRGCALFGILLMNIVGMGLGPAYDNPTIAGGDKGINLWTWFVINVGFEGTQRALFSILFGAGVILLTSRLEKSGRPDATDIFFRRNLWLVAFGLFNAWVLLWVGDILYYYGITALFLFAFRKLAGKTLLALGVGSLLIGAAWSAMETRGMLRLHSEAQAAQQVAPAKRTAEQKEAIEQWQKESRAGPPPERYAEARKENTASYWSALKSRSEVIKHFQSWNLYRDFFDIFGMMMIGMAFFRLGVLTLDVPKRIYLAMMVGGYAVGLAGNLSEARWIMTHEFSGLAYNQAHISYDISRLAMTTGHLGLLMLFLSSGFLPWLRQSMAAVGRMALTNYLSHSVMALVVFVLLGYWGALQRYQLYLIVLAVWAIQIVVSPIWLRHFHFGPVEWLWRYLTYGKAPPFRRGRGEPPAFEGVAVPAE
jgi:uncharacterized protein